MRQRCDAAIWAAGEHGAGHRSSLFGAVGGGRVEASIAEMGVDETYLGKKQKFVTVVSNPESREPLSFGDAKKKETLDEFFRTQLSRKQRRGSRRPVCLEMWAPYRLSLGHRVRDMLNCCPTRLAMGVVEAINGNINIMLPRGPGTQTSITCL